MVFFKKKKVLLISPSGLNNGGVQSVLMTVVRNLCNSYTFDILVFNDYQNFYKNEFSSFGGKIFVVNKVGSHSLFLKIINRINFIKKLNKTLNCILKANHYDIVHCNNQFDSGIVLKKAKKYNIPCRICHSHGFYPKVPLLKELIRKRKRKIIRRYSTNLIGCSKEACTSLFGVNSNYSVVNNPYDNSLIHFSNKTSSKLAILQIGMFNDNKNQTFSLEVLYNLLKKIDAELHLMGTGDNKKILNKIQNLRLENKVIFHKHNENKMSVFENNSYLIMPSKKEGFGIALIEAQAAGLYCFASNTIPKSTNCDGVFYLDLKLGPEEWANIIFDFYKRNKGTKNLFNCSKYSTEKFVETMKKIYQR